MSARRWGAVVLAAAACAPARPASAPARPASAPARPASAPASRGDDVQVATPGKRGAGGGGARGGDAREDRAPLDRCLGDVPQPIDPAALADAYARFARGERVTTDALERSLRACGGSYWQPLDPGLVPCRMRSPTVAALAFRGCAVRAPDGREEERACGALVVDLAARSWRFEPPPAGEVDTIPGLPDPVEVVAVDAADDTPRFTLAPVTPHVFAARPRAVDARAGRIVVATEPRGFAVHALPGGRRVARLAAAPWRDGVPQDAIAVEPIGDGAFALRALSADAAGRVQLEVVDARGRTRATHVGRGPDGYRDLARLPAPARVVFAADTATETELVITSARGIATTTRLSWTAPRAGTQAVAWGGGSSGAVLAVARGDELVFLDATTLRVRSRVALPPVARDFVAMDGQFLRGDAVFGLVRDGAFVALRTADGAELARAPASGDVLLRDAADPAARVAAVARDLTTPAARAARFAYHVLDPAGTLAYVPATSTRVGGSTLVHLPGARMEGGCPLERVLPVLPPLAQYRRGVLVPAAMVPPGR